MDATPIALQPETLPADGSPCWLVDPICGTRNYASGAPLYCVNIALTERGTVTKAVVGDASKRQIHVAFWTDSAVHAAAASLLAAEAGGTVSDLAGEPWRLDSDAILAAASPGLHAALLDMITAASPA